MQKFISTFKRDCLFPPVPSLCWTWAPSAIRSRKWSSPLNRFHRLRSKATGPRYNTTAAHKKVSTFTPQSGSVATTPPCLHVRVSRGLGRNDFYNVSEASLESEREVPTLCPLAIAHIHRTIQALERTSSDPRRLSASRAQARQHLPTGRARRSTHCSRPARHDHDAFLRGERTERHHAKGAMIEKESARARE
jgi:hypothetical protein